MRAEVCSHISIIVLQCKKCHACAYYSHLCCVSAAISVPLYWHTSHLWLGCIFSLFKLVAGSISCPETEHKMNLLIIFQWLLNKALAIPGWSLWTEISAVFFPVSCLLTLQPPQTATHKGSEQVVLVTIHYALCLLRSWVYFLSFVKGFDRSGAELLRPCQVDFLCVPVCLHWNCMGLAEKGLLGVKAFSVTFMHLQLTFARTARHTAI